MESIRFAHLSDTHVSADACIHPAEYALPRDPNRALEEALRDLRHADLDFITISGDLTHTGSMEDYTCLKRILKENDPGVPVLLALGNHDRQQPFRAVLLHEPSPARYYYATEIKGLRVIVLDSAAPGEKNGSLDDGQLDWLEQTLSVPSEQGSICILHHPVFWDHPPEALQNPDRLIRILNHSDVRSIFCGHLHINRTEYRNGFLQSIAESLAFGSYENPRPDEPSPGHHLCTINQSAISIHPKGTHSRVGRSA